MGKAVLLALAMLMSVASSSSGLDLAGTIRTDATASDNIHRDGSGLEENGSLLTQGVGAQVSEERGLRTLNLSVDVGWETLDSESRSSTDEIYRINLNAHLPWSRTGWLEGNASTSQETEAPDLEDQDQGRMLVKRSEVGFLMGSDVTPTSRWQVEAGTSRERSADQDLEETTSSIQWSNQISRMSTVSLRGTLTDGQEEVEENSWRSYSAFVGMNVRITPALTRSYELTWERSTVEELDGTENRSERVGLDVRHLLQKASGWTYEGIVGLDNVKTASNEEMLEPRGELTATGPLSRVVEADGSIGMYSQIQDPLDLETEWTREGRLIAGFNWSTSRFFSVGPRVEYLYEDIQGRDVPDSVDQTVVLRVDTRWTPSSTWVMELGVAIENRESTEPSNELAERRLELHFSNLYR